MSLAVKSVAGLANWPTRRWKRRPLVTSATRRPGPLDRAHSTADDVVTSPLCTPDGSVSLRRTSTGAPLARAATPLSAMPAVEARKVRRPRTVMSGSVVLYQGYVNKAVPPRVDAVSVAPLDSPSG